MLMLGDSEFHGFVYVFWTWSQMLYITLAKLTLYVLVSTAWIMYSICQEVLCVCVCVCSKISFLFLHVTANKSIMQLRPCLAACTEICLHQMVCVCVRACVYYMWTFQVVLQDQKIMWLLAKLFFLFVLEGWLLNWTDFKYSLLERERERELFYKHTWNLLHRK